MDARKVLFALTSHSRKGDTGQSTGWYLPEAAHPWKPLHEEGWEIDFVSPRGGAAPVDGFDLSDPVNREFWNHPQVGDKLKRTLAPHQVPIGEYRALLFVGGHGTMWDFPEDPLLPRLAAELYDAGGVVGAICHGPAGLINVKLADGRYLVEGKRLAAFTNEEERAVGLEKVVPFLLADRLAERGGLHVAAPKWTENVVADGRLLTGQNPQSARALGLKLAALLR